MREKMIAVALVLSLTFSWALLSSWSSWSESHREVSEERDHYMKWAFRHGHPIPTEIDRKILALEDAEAAVGTSNHEVMWAEYERRLKEIPPVQPCGGR